jgi:hypothetical protein
MKATLAIALTVLTITTAVQAKGIIGTVDKYIIIKSGKIIEVASNKIDNGVATYFDYTESRRKTIETAEISKSTRQRIAGVKIGDIILANTYARNSNSQTVTRFCEVFSVFENKEAYIGCQTLEADKIKGYTTPARLDFVVNNVETLTAQVQQLDGFKKGGNYELRVDTTIANAGVHVKILGIFVNGDVLVQKSILSVLDSDGIIAKTGDIARIKLSDLNN